MHVGHRMDPGGGIVELRSGRRSVPGHRQVADSERFALMGGSLAKIYNWSPDKGG